MMGKILAKGEKNMSKEEIALELTRLAYVNAERKNKSSGQPQPAEEVVTNLYNYIFTHMDSEQNK